MIDPGEDRQPATLDRVYKADDSLAVAGRASPGDHSLDRGRVARLVQAELPTAREPDRGQEPPALVADRPAQLDALGLQLLGGPLEVVAHQVELLPATLFVGVRGHLRG